LFIAKNLERIGDHATNIAEIIHYEISGEELPPERPKWDSLRPPPAPGRKARNASPGEAHGGAR
jgi:hypothetical protein